MDKLISTLENDAYTMMVHKRSLNYANSWCVEAKKFFFPFRKSFKYTFFLRVAKQLKLVSMPLQ